MPNLSLRSQLSLEKALLLDLERCLQDERQALIQQDIERLKQASESKAQLLTQFEGRVQDRLASFGVEGENSWDVFVETQHPGVSSLWQAVKQQLESVLRVSAANALAINAAKARNLHIRDLLHRSQDRPNLYNRQGTQEGAESRDLGSA